MDEIIGAVVQTLGFTTMPIGRQLRWHTLRRMRFADVEPLWVTGCALLLVIAVRVFTRFATPLHGKRGDWALYLTLGTIFPAIVVLLTVLMQAQRSSI